MSLCQSIDTLAMAFLDDDLAAQERRELELHLLDCASCRGHVDSERADLELVRKALVPPPAPALLKARIARALDAEDTAVARQGRRRLSQWLLPGSAMAAAAAALLVVFTGPAGNPRSSAVTADVAKQEIHPAPLEVRGASTGQWLRTNFAAVEPPQFAEPGITLLGARLLPNGIANHDAALLSYMVTVGSARMPLTAVVLKDLRRDELGDGPAYRVGDLTLRVDDSRGIRAVTYIDPNDHVGYVFVSERLTAGELIQLVVSTDLISRAQERR